jgi:hypothetical protein
MLDDAFGGGGEAGGGWGSNISTSINKKEYSDSNSLFFQKKIAEGVSGSSESSGCHYFALGSCGCRRGLF